ncbi:RCC1 domain-containing protein [Methanocella conradii]|uniref:RCC1 domain-containing protein n=1 Tax=Methanocella conradii TaxID=1175444 RepID=UPI00157D2BE1|nr:RCC1 domain-containing protein [Methanocella conradii]
MGAHMFNVFRILSCLMAILFFVDSMLMTALASPSPMPVKVAAGNAHVLLLTSDGSVWAWGSNDYGECGPYADGLDTVLKPVRVPISGVKDVAAGHCFSMALKNDGTVWVWGSNDFGQLGLGTVDNESHPEPIQVKGLTDIMAIDARSELAVALGRDGTVWAWGQNDHGQVGDGGPLADPKAVMSSPEEWNKWVSANISVPTKVVDLSGVDSIVSGGSFALALKDDGSVWYWGQNSSVMGDRSLSLSGSIGTSRPILAQTVDGIRDIGAGSGFALILKDDGTVWGWGTDGDGILGKSTNQSYVLIYDPVRMPSLSNIRSIAPGANHGAALDGDGNVWTWGSNYKGQIGNGKVSNDPQLTPYKVPISNVKFIESGTLFTVAITDDGSIWAWGFDERGQLGDGSAGEGLCRPAPVKVQMDLSRQQLTGPCASLMATPHASDVVLSTPSATGVPSAPSGSSADPGILTAPETMFSVAAFAGIAIYLIKKSKW